MFALIAALTLSLSPMAVQFVTSTLIPVLTGLITKSGASVKLKQVVTLILNAVSAVVIANLTVDGGAKIVENTLFLAAMGLVVSITTYLGIYKPNDLNEKVSPRHGLGKEGPSPAEQAILDDIQGNRTQ